MQTQLRFVVDAGLLLLVALVDVWVGWVFGAYHFLLNIYIYIYTMIEHFVIMGIDVEEKGNFDDTHT